MKKLPIFLAFLILFTVAAVAQEEDSKPGTTPDSLLWGLDVAFDRISLALTRGDERKAEKALDIAEERLAEIRQMVEENKLEQSERARIRHEEFLARVQRHVDEVEDEDELEEFEKEVEIEKRLLRHKERLYDLEARIEVRGDLTEDQQQALDNLLASLGDDVEKVEIKILARQNRTKVRIRERYEDAEKRIDELEEDKWQRRALHEQEKAALAIRRAEEKLSSFEEREADLNKDRVADEREWILRAEEEIKRAKREIVEADQEGREFEAAMVRLREASSLLEQARKRLLLGELDDSEELAMKAEEYAQESRMKYLGKTREELGLTDVTGRVSDMDSSNIDKNLSEDDDEMEDKEHDDIECKIDSDCDSDEFCDDGECEDLENDDDEDDMEEDELECKVDNDCDSDEFCDDGECEDLDDDDEEEEHEDKEIDDNILRDYNLSIELYDTRTVATAKRYLEHAKSALRRSERLFENGDYKASYAYARYARKLANRALSGKYLNEDRDRDHLECKVDSDCDSDEFCDVGECENLDDMEEEKDMEDDHNEESDDDMEDVNETEES